MIELNATLLIQMVNFLILLAILNLILYRPIRGIIKRRSEKLAADMNDVEKFNEQAEKKLHDYEQSLQEARTEAGAIRNEYRGEGSEKEKEIVDQAKQEAAQELEESRKQLRQQREGAQQKLLQEIDQYAEKVAQKVMS
ncbi:MAG: ATP synthase F0 subunit B [Desulfohalobiaceae bacterium]|nr:ATP synthase F0 subunit B [Desulfohalobiaceae bacterium]